MHAPLLLSLSQSSPPHTNNSQRPSNILKMCGYVSPAQLSNTVFFYYFPYERALLKVCDIYYFFSLHFANA